MYGYRLYYSRQWTTLSLPWNSPIHRCRDQRRATLVSFRMITAMQYRYKYAYEHDSGFWTGNHMPMRRCAIPKLVVANSLAAPSR
jgi:hypothetical protein